MAESQPINKMDVIGELGRAPEKAVGEFKLSLTQNKLDVNTQSWDLTTDELDICFLRDLWQHNLMKRAQSEMLEHKKMELRKNNHRLRIFYKNQADLRQQFVKVNGFLKDCADKRALADKKLKIEKEEQDMFLKNIEETKASFAELSKFRAALQKTVNKYRLYEKIIQDVVAKSEIYESEKDCVDRCDALMLAQTEIHADMLEKISEIETIQKRMIQLTKEAALTILGMQNMLAQLDRDYKTASNECQKWEKLIGVTKDAILQNNFNKERITDAIRVMYRLLCRRRSIDTLYEREHIEGELDLIKYELEMMNEILQEYYRRHKDDGSGKGKIMASKGVKC